MAKQPTKPRTSSTSPTQGANTFTYDASAIRVVQVTKLANGQSRSEPLGSWRVHSVPRVGDVLVIGTTEYEVVKVEHHLPMGGEYANPQVLIRVRLLPIPPSQNW